MRRITLVRLALAAALVVGPSAHAQIAVINQGYMPYTDAPINYRADNVNDPVQQLQRKLDAGKAKLRYNDKDGHGYLKSVLDLLDIPLSSQTLVFSKTSFQYPKITPEHPRALYYNDDVYIGQVHEGKEIEVVSFDKNQGAVFYILHEQKTDKPRFERAELDCTQCHIAAGTRGIPGVLLRSVPATSTGTLVAGAKTYITDQDSPLNQRWGGWYVTGALAAKTQANAVAPGDANAKTVKFEPLQAGYNAKDFLAPTSEDVALLVLGHQTQMHNLITLTNYRTRIALYELGGDAAVAAPPAFEQLPDNVREKIERPAEQLLRYALFSNETPLPDLDAKQIIATSRFARDFAARGPRDPQGRSLRDFDLNKRIFRYPVSYLVYSEDFDALPEPARGYVWHRLLEVLTGKDTSGDFDALSTEDRRVALEILLQTKHGLPTEWLDYARANRLHAAR
ncbi:MAG: hypothetical protein WDO12_08365 [Pseudomonadota bacterium]